MINLFSIVLIALVMCLTSCSSKSDDDGYLLSALAQGNDGNSASQEELQDESFLVGTWICPSAIPGQFQYYSGYKFTLEDNNMGYAILVDFETAFGWKSSGSWNSNIINWEISQNKIIISGLTFLERQYPIIDAYKLTNGRRIIRVNDPICPEEESLFYECLTWNCSDVPGPPAIVNP